jgi:hypothetical protein
MMKKKHCNVGIDFSMNSAAICIEKDNKIFFFVYPRAMTVKMESTMKSSEVGCEIVTKEKPDDYDKNIATRERFNSQDARRLTTEILNHLKYFLNGYDVNIAIEGIAFMSRGNSIAQFSGYHYILRHELSTLTDYDNIFVYQPTSVKKVAGKGNFKKPDMINAFINSTDPTLAKTSFHKMLKNDIERFQSPRAKNFLKPVDDIVDSYWVLQCLLQDNQ